MESNSKVFSNTRGTHERRFKEIGEELGFKYVASGPMVRSSYKAGEFFMENMIKQERKVDSSTIAK